ncbi:MAG: 5-(carboxyamino)imidazole ribonucleotide mutase [Thermoproteota archaeon]|nr:5-(carboxyamino)imidazole ribonucleotide mutase [Thermoproteota archaeon]
MQRHHHIQKGESLAFNQGDSSSRKKEKSTTTLVSIVAPSLKLLDKMKDAVTVLDAFQVPYSIAIVAAHRAPRKTLKFVSDLETNGTEVIIAGGAGSAHLPGMLASLTTIAIIGVPLRGDSLDGIDSLYSIVQMPRGVPVGTMGIDSAYNAGVFACQILGLKYPHLKQKLVEHKQVLEKEVEAEDTQLKNGKNKQKGNYS